IPSLLPPPVPFKIFVLSAGVFGIPYRRLAATLILARGFRYLFWGGMGIVYGDEALALLRRVDHWFGDRMSIILTLVAAVVVAPFEGTPAHKLGIRAGDVISKIEGEDARGMSIDDAVKRLRGPKGSPVKITIVRQGYETPLEFTVIRDEIPLHSVPYFFMATK